MDIGLFVNASTATIPTSVQTVYTSGYKSLGYGGASYHVADLSSSYLSAHPHSTFTSSDGRAFQLSGENTLNATSFGVIADGQQINDTQWDGTDSTEALAECLSVASEGNSAVLLPGGMIVVSSIVLHGNSVLVGQGKRDSIIYHKNDSQLPLFVLSDPLSNGVRCSDFTCWGHYGAGEDCFRLWPTKNAGSDFAFLDAASFSRLLIMRFGGKGFWFAGGDTTFDTPCQFVTIEDVQIDTPYINDGSRCFTATGQAAQFTFLGSNRFDGSFPYGSAESMAGCNICLSGRYERTVNGVVVYADAFEAGCHLNDGNPMGNWTQIGLGGCSGYYWGTWGAIQGALYGVYLQNTEIDFRAYFENVRRAVTVCNSIATISECRANNGAGDWLIKSIGQASASRIWFGRNRVAGDQATALYQRGANLDRFQRIGDDVTGGDESGRTSNFSQDIAPISNRVTINQRTNYLHGPGNVSMIASSSVPGDQVSFVILDGAIVFQSGGNIAVDAGLTANPRDIIHLIYFENIWRLMSVVRAS